MYHVLVCNGEQQRARVSTGKQHCYWQAIMSSKDNIGVCFCCCARYSMDTRFGVERQICSCLLQCEQIVVEAIDQAWVGVPRQQQGGQGVGAQEAA